MQPYQEEYIQNCKTYQALASPSFLAEASFDDAFQSAMDRMSQADALARRNTALLQDHLLPVLDDLYDQDEATCLEMEAFADALSAYGKPLDLALAEQLLSALLSVARRIDHTPTLIRLLYKLGMVRYSTYSMLTGLSLPEVDSYSDRMRYCFVEAASYLDFFEEFQDDETKSYILRSLANLYLGKFADWRERLACVRRTTQVFQDESIRAAAPSLPWDRYMSSIHQQIVSVFPRSDPDGSLSPDEVQDVMEAAHQMYALQIEADRAQGKSLDAHRLTPYYSIEYACGLITKEALLSHMEELMDAADPTRYDENTNYQIISMPAFYAQYLRSAPQLVSERRDYITRLYRRALDYVRSMPPGEVTRFTQLYVRQITTVFLEVEGGITYLDMVRSLMTWFAPELYPHGDTVGRMAQLLARQILSEEPEYFDDIPQIRDLPPQQKLAAAQEMAFTAGLIHDMGKINFTALYSHAGRQTLSGEAEALQLHTQVGWKRLTENQSSAIYADVALGHHCWYDGSDGYPSAYVRLQSPCRALVDIIAFAEFLDSEGEDDTSLPRREVPFEEKIRQAISLEGRRFSPMITGWLHTPALLEPLKALYDDARREGYYQCFLHAVHPKDSTP